MKHPKHLLGALLLCVVIAVPAKAFAGKTYTGIAFGQFKQTASTGAFSDNGNSSGRILYLGTRYNEYVAMEFRYTDAGKANLPFSATPIAPATMETSAGSLLIRIFFPLSESLHLYGVGGHSNVSFKTTGGLIGTATKYGLSYGGGLEYVSRGWNAGIEWINLLSTTTVSNNIQMGLSGYAFSVTLKF